MAVLGASEEESLLNAQQVKLAEKDGHEQELLRINEDLLYIDWRLDRIRGVKRSDEEMSQEVGSGTKFRGLMKCKGCNFYEYNPCMPGADDRLYCLNGHCGMRRAHSIRHMHGHCCFRCENRDPIMPHGKKCQGVHFIVPAKLKKKAKP